MNEDFKFFGLTPLFGAVGALATAAAWHIFAFTLLDLVPAQLAVLSCLVAGLAGPLLVWVTVWIMTRRRGTLFASALRRAASVGLGLVLAAELGFYIPLGFFAIAFH
jgi:hypothetical protein